MNTQPRQKLRPSSMAKAAVRTSECLKQCRQDYLYCNGFVTKEINASDSNSESFLLRFGPFDYRRNLDPRYVTADGLKCFCDWERDCPQVPGNECFPIGNSSSNMFLRDDRSHQYANSCGPEPSEEHYADMVDLASQLTTRSLTVVNLANSGASIPQHFHTQIYPLDDFELTKNSIRRLWEGVRVEGEPDTINGITLTKVIHPVWGIKLSFSDQYSPRRCGELIYEILHRRIRYRSQLGLTYNLFLDSNQPRDFVVLIRDSRKERIFQLEECHDVMRQFTTTAEANRIARSPNRHWRWAWLELIGGFPARDASFADVEVFTWRFWSELLAIASLEPSLQNEVLTKVVDGLETCCRLPKSPRRVRR